MSDSRESQLHEPLMSPHCGPYECEATDAPEECGKDATHRGEAGGMYCCAHWGCEPELGDWAVRESKRSEPVSGTIYPEPKLPSSTCSCSVALDPRCPLHGSESQLAPDAACGCRGRHRCSYHEGMLDAPKTTVTTCRGCGEDVHVSTDEPGWGSACHPSDCDRCRQSPLHVPGCDGTHYCTPEWDEVQMRLTAVEAERQRVGVLRVKAERERDALRAALREIQAEAHGHMSDTGALARACVQIIEAKARKALHG